MDSWVEFIANGGRIRVRVCKIVYFETMPLGYTKLGLELGSDRYKEIVVSEEPNQVEKKIAEARKIGLKSSAVECFTREEYDYLLRLVDRDGSRPPESYQGVQMFRKVRSKLTKILKEEK